jgi:subtilase family serine protease
MHTLHRLARLSTVPALLLFSFFSFAQAPRIRGPIESSPSVTLEGSLNPHVRIADDLGPLAPETAIRGVTLVFKRSTAQETDLQQLLAQQIDPSSPLFHHWLTPDEFATRFGVADEDIAATVSWLLSHGFTIDDVSRSRDRITFSGNAAQIHQALGAELHRFRERAGGTAELHFAPASELSLPPSLAPVTAAILHLSDFRPRPSIRTVHPDYTTLSGQQHFLGPRDIAVMYDLLPLYNSSFYGSSQSLAVVGQSYVPTDSSSALFHFQTLLAQANPVDPILVPNSGVEAAFPLDEAEADIDLEYSSGIAQNASIFFVYTGSSPNYDVFDALGFAVTQDIAPVISVSYGACEPLMSTADLQQYNAILEQAGAQGQTVVASSGDAGATACADYSTSSGVTAAAQQQLAVSFPASSPYVTGVGGAQMASASFASGTNNYWSSASNIDNVQSLLSYVPELAWNESSPTDGIIAGGGGTSSVFARPAWQTGVPGIPSGSYRLVPDIAFQASVFHPGYIVCSDDPALSGASSDCAGGSVTNSNNTYVLDGGTSFAAPIFAGFLAVLNEYKDTLGLGSINPTLYSLAAQPSVYASAFHDITSGTTACSAGETNCGSAGESVYAATTGYDMATGLGSVDLYNLANAWPSGAPSTLATTGTLFNNPQLSAVAGQALNVQILVSPLYQPHGSSVPTGTLSISLDGQPLTTSLAISPTNPAEYQASVTYTVFAPSTLGSHVVIARYSGDATHAPSQGTYPILVGNNLASGSVNVSAANLTVSANSTGSTSVTITPSGGYNGELSWTATVTGSVQQTVCYVVTAPSVNGVTTGTAEIGVGSACGSPTGSMRTSAVHRSSLQPHPSTNAPAAVTFLAVLLFGTIPSRRRKLLPLLSTAFLTLIAFTLTGCGGGSGSGDGGGGGGGTNPPPAYYTVTLKAQDSVNPSITASTSFTLTVD